ncbi:MAG: prepilin-type N-terminal cleavage/methylation domain-containing protein [Elusimicrobiales bacterium]|nr:prepilin-type N-terminal cleavage/methylation domain-containing protein [Elusimicrobiales bacterium]
MVKKRPGYTLMELMLVVAILGVLTLGAPQLFTRVYQFVRLTMARAEIQKNAREALSNVNRELRQAVATSVVIDQVSGQPPHSRITFDYYKSDGTVEQMSYYQRGRQLFQARQGAAEGRLVADSLRYLAFSYPRTDDDTIISLSVTFEKDTYEGGTKALQMAVEKVRIMN